MSKVVEEISLIFAQVLGKTLVPTDRNYFDIGATSISLTKIHAKIQQRLGIELPLVDMYTAPTILDLAELVETRQLGSIKNKA